MAVALAHALAGHHQPLAPTLARRLIPTTSPSLSLSLSPSARSRRTSPTLTLTLALALTLTQDITKYGSRLYELLGTHAEAKEMSSRALGKNRDVQPPACA